MRKYKTIQGYTDYQISNYGMVKSLKYNKEKILKPSNDKDGYLILSLNNKISKTFSIHRLVAQAFIPNPDHKPQVNHKDGNKQNNYVDNLEWCTHSENLKHGIEIGLINQKGENNSQAKLFSNEVLAIHGLYLSGITQLELSKIYSVSCILIRKIVNGKKWKQLIGVSK